MQPRDFYDIWYLLEIHETDIAFYLDEFKAKCISKDIDPRQFFEKLVQRKPSYKGRWQQSMAAQINDLPDFDRVERGVQRHIKNLSI